MSEFEGIRLFVALNWFVDDFSLKTKKYFFMGDAVSIAEAYRAAYEGSCLLAAFRDRMAPLLEMGFELRQEAVPSTVEGIWFNMYFVSFGAESKDLKKTQVVDFITKNLEKMGLISPELNFKLFYLPPLPAATTTEGHHMYTLSGFTNIHKKRIEINVFPPRDYLAIFRNLVHEIIHMCILEKSKQEKAAAVEAEVENYTNIFLSKFSKDWKLVEKPILEELHNTIDKELAIFSKADAYLLGNMDISKSQAVIKTMLLFSDAVLNQTVTLEPKS